MLHHCARLCSHSLFRKHAYQQFYLGITIFFIPPIFDLFHSINKQVASRSSRNYAKSYYYVVLSIEEYFRNEGYQATISATFWAASARSVALISFNPDSARIRRPSSTLVPSMRTTTGTERETFWAACTTP